MSCRNRRVRPPLAWRTALAIRASPGSEAIVPGAQERAARDVADAGRFDDQCARLSLGESRVPLDDFVGDHAVLGRAPRDHGGNPRAAGESEAADVQGSEPPRACGRVA